MAHGADGAYAVIKRIWRIIKIWSDTLNVPDAN